MRHQMGSVVHDLPPLELAAAGYGWLSLIFRRPGGGRWAGDFAGLRQFLAPPQAAGMQTTWHYPVLNPPTDDRLVGAPDWWEDAPAREREWARFEADVQAAQQLGAANVVLHFINFPAAQPLTSIDTGLLHEHLTRLATIQATAKIPLCLECFTDPAWLADQVARYGLHICLDTGHLFTTLQQQGGYTPARYLEAAAILSPLAPIIHLWNTRGIPSERHVPFHPDQAPADGWMPIPALLETALRLRPTSAIVAEPSLSRHPRERFWAGMAWLASHLSQTTRNTQGPNRV